MCRGEQHLSCDKFLVVRLGSDVPIVTSLSSGGPIVNSGEQQHINIVDFVWSRREQTKLMEDRSRRPEKKQRKHRKNKAEERRMNQPPFFPVFQIPIHN
ncbi:hypothetical protein DM860_014171 [Cuscuta australis]|uniref:Uncharacterized protein n=1 Tax=Cuscuta australis TaxID=267555 RepID=A0A328DES5_9ASTE|nr:hypothetical protein DM860_014171 [Cuscuta australis]